jgi:hypothetical protein
VVDEPPHVVNWLKPKDDNPDSNPAAVAVCVYSVILRARYHTTTRKMAQAKEAWKGLGVAT